MENRKPNILWICTDQQRFDTLGCYGNTFVNTPVLDKLAEEGALFETAISQSPVCSPSRGCFLTGRYPNTCRTRQNGADIPDTEVLVTKLFHEHGYYCGLSGKLHIRACNPKSGCTEIESRIDDGYDEFHWSHDTAPVWGLHNEYYHWLDSKFGKTYTTSKSKESKWVEYGMPEKQSQSYWCAEKAIDFIKQNQDRPWLFSVNMYDPHHPFDPPKELFDTYLKNLGNLPLPNYTEGEEKTKTIWQQQDNTGAYNHHAGYPFSEMNEKDHRMLKAAYYAMCDNIDIQVGRMLEALKETDQYDNTIIVFHSDHGEMLGDHGVYLKGPFFYDCCIRVPLIISWPGHIKPARYPQLVELMDIPQTLLELCGYERYEGMQGSSIVPLLEGKKEVLHTNAYADYMNAMPWHRNPIAYASMVRTEDWKLIVSHAGNGEGELYDLKEDSAEQHNLFHLPAYRDIKLELYAQLLDRWAQQIDPFPVRKADW